MSDSKSAVADVSQQFGIIIAFLLPGFIFLWPFQYFSPTVAIWFRGAGFDGSGTSPSGGSFLLVVVASLAAGLLISAIRWAVFDCLLLRRFRRIKIDYSRLEEKLTAFTLINENHYRYYQYYSNSSIALIGWAVAQALRGLPRTPLLVASVVAFLVVELILFLAARDALDKNISKLLSLLGEVR